MHDAFFLRSAHSANAMWVDPPLRTSGTVPRRKPWLWSSIQFEFFLLVLSRGSPAGYMTSLCCGFLIRRLDSHNPLQSQREGTHHGAGMASPCHCPSAPLPPTPALHMQHMQRERAITWQENALEYIHHSTQLGAQGGRGPLGGKDVNGASQREVPSSPLILPEGACPG